MFDYVVLTIFSNDLQRRKRSQYYNNLLSFEEEEHKILDTGGSIHVNLKFLNIVKRNY